MERSSYHSRGNFDCRSSVQVGGSAEGQGFLNAVPWELAWCEGRAGFVLVVDQRGHDFVLDILYVYADTGLVCFFAIYRSRCFEEVGDI